VSVSTNLLEVQNLTVRREKEILAGVSFAVPAGEMLMVLGPSGAGKSTLLRCLNRLDPVDGGRVLLGGEDIARMDVKILRRRVGMVFQVPALIPDTVRANIRLGPSLRGQVLPDGDCEQLLRAVGLASGFLDRQVETLSLGEQQRVAFAQVLANRPEVLLLDEPTSALDPTAVLTIENLIRQVHEELHTATLLVTHSVEQALRFNTETLVLLEGRIIARGPIQQLVTGSSDERLRRFFEGRLNDSQGESS